MSRRVLRGLRSALALFVLVLVVGAFGAGVTAGTDAGPDNTTVAPEVSEATGEQTVLVYFGSDDVTTQEGVTPADLEDRMERAQGPLERYAASTPGVTVENQFWLGNVAVVEVDHDRVDVADLAALDGVDRLTPNFEVTVEAGSTRPAASTPTAGSPGYTAPALDDPGTLATQTTYGLDQIEAPQVWSTYNTKGSGTSVAVLDTGVDPDHPDIDLTKWQEWDSNGNPEDTQPQDYGEHGTHVSGTVLGGNTSGEYIGVAPDADLYHGAVLTDCSSDGCIGTFAQIIAGMQWAVGNNVDVVSMSLGAEGYFERLIDPVRNTRSAGVVVVSSIGNSGSGTSGSPGNIYETFSVGASDEFRNIDSRSAGEQIDTSSDWGSDAPSDWPSQYTVPTVSAPGVAVKSAVPGGGYKEKRGTSMAAPHVSGAAALVQAATSSDLSVSAIETALVDTAENPNGDVQDSRYGHGIIDVKAAVDSLTGSAPANFAVTVDGTNSPVSEGETITVDATVENTGDESATQTITLNIGGLGSDSTSVTLASGESQQVSLSVGTGSGDGGEYTATVESSDDSDSTGVTVNQPANFAVSVSGTNSPVAEGEPVEVTAFIENTGDEDDTQTVALNVGSLGSDATSVPLAGGESRTVTLELSTGSGDAGDYTATVQSENDSDSTDLTVETPANFAVSVSGTNSPVSETERLAVTATVENTGDRSGTQQVDLAVESLGTDSTSVSLAGGESTSGDAGEYTATVGSEDDTDSTTVTVEQPPANFAVSVNATNSPVTEGDPLLVEATVENTGDQSATQTVTLDAGSLGSNATSVSLAGGKSTSVSLSVPTGSGDAGEYTATVSSEDDSDSTDTVVAERAPANFAVTVDGTNSPVTEGETLSVEATVENTGELSDTQPVSLDAGSLGTNATSVSLGPGESTSVTLELSTGSGDAGAYTATIGSEDDSASTAVQVKQPARFGVEFVETNSPVLTAETLDVTVRVTNTGGAAGTQTVGLVVGTTQRDAAELTLAGGESRTVTLSWATTAGDADDYDVAVTSDDSAVQSIVRVAADESERGPPPIATDAAPQDPDGDGTYQDLNGDGRLTLTDVQLFLEHREDLVVQDHAEYFDFDDNGAVTLADVQALLQAHLQG